MLSDSPLWWLGPLMLALAVFGPPLTYALLAHYRELKRQRALAAQLRRACLPAWEQRD